MAVYRVTLRGTVAGQTQNNVRYWINNDPVPDFQAFADDLGVAFETAIAGLTSQDTIWTDLYVSNALVGSLGTVVIPANFPFAGTALSTGRLPVHDAVLLRYSGNPFAYPKQNRNRISGALEGSVENGVLTASAITLWEGVADVLSGVFTPGTGWTPTLWSDRYQTSGLFVNSSVSPIISTQRSRRVGVGG